jgi:protein with PEP-CTERM/exosortase system signal
MNTCLVAFTVVITAALSQPVLAQVPSDNIVLTENSPTSLTVTLDGSTTGITVTNTAPDQWDVIFASSILFSPNTRLNWTEPENPAQVNGVFAGNQAAGLGFPVVQSNEMLVFSDTTPLALAQSTMPNGGTTPFAIGFEFENPGGPSRVIFGTFNDNAATAEASVPDTGSTFVLLFLSLTALFGASRFRSVRLA